MSKTSRKKTAAKTPTRRRKKVELPLQTLRGMRDILPAEQPYWERVRQVFAKVAAEYGFARIDTPLVEFEDLFVRSVGEKTEVIEKEMYAFVTKGGDRVALRPELTAGNARAFVQHGMSVWPKPIKLFSAGAVYRYDRPQHGRWREHFQGNFDIYGESDPVLDAQLLQMAKRILDLLGIKNVVFRVNSIGSVASRNAYKRKLSAYFEKFRRKLPKEMRPLIKENPFRILDSKDEVCAEISADAPRAGDSLDDDSRRHFEKLVSYLDELSVPYEIDGGLVRGLDYYTGAVFEIYIRDEAFGKRYSLGGGGRYDELISSLGGEETPAIGFGLGMDRLVLEMQRLGVRAAEAPKPRVFLAQLGEAAKKKSLSLFVELQKAGILTAESFGRGNLRAQLRRAEKAQVDVTLIIGQKEALDDTVIVKDMNSGTQETVMREKMIPAVKKILKSKPVVRR
ncbi:MAG TPA: histidine--tRNA ligase [Candidatus Moranbacteria bacterium]|nr:histidine--tRNA ligase [Candidatus Moranbacteria bacterium]